MATILVAAGNPCPPALCALRTTTCRTRGNIARLLRTLTIIAGTILLIGTVSAEEATPIPERGVPPHVETQAPIFEIPLQEAVVAVVGACLLLTVVFWIAAVLAPPAQATPDDGDPSSAAQDLPRENPEYDKLLHEVYNEALETDDYSPAWCCAAASARSDALLVEAPIRRSNEAARQIEWEKRDEEFQRIGAYAWRRHGLDAHRVITLLEDHDRWEYRLLQEAIRIKEESMQNKKEARV